MKVAYGSLLYGLWGKKLAISISLDYVDQLNRPKTRKLPTPWHNVLMCTRNTVYSIRVDDAVCARLWVGISCIILWLRDRLGIV